MQRWDLLGCSRPYKFKSRHWIIFLIDFCMQQLTSKNIMQKLLRNENVNLTLSWVTPEKQAYQHNRNLRHRKCSSKSGHCRVVSRLGSCSRTDNGPVASLFLVLSSSGGGVVVVSPEVITCQVSMAMCTVPRNPGKSWKRTSQSILTILCDLSESIVSCILRKNAKIYIYHTFKKPITEKPRIETFEWHHCCHISCVDSEAVQVYPNYDTVWQ